MKTIFSFAFACSILALSAVGCDKKPDDSKAAASSSGDKKGGDVAAKGKTDDNKPAAPAGGVSLAKLGLKCDLPSDSIVSDGLGKNGQMINAASTSINVAEADDDSPKDLKAAQDDASAFNPKDLKAETLSDGFAVSFKNTGSMGDNYWVTVRRKIGGKDVMCTGVLDTADKQAAALAACKSLKA